MIDKSEIIEFSREFGLRANVIEKDYVLGWVLAGIFNHSEIGASWVFKGGTCLKKCYLFAKLNYADVCLQKGKPEKIPGIFDHKFDLKLLYPNRSTFHISELAGFTGIICKYYIAVGDREAAELLFKNLKQIAPKHPATKNVKKVLYPSFIGRLFRK